MYQRYHIVVILATYLLGCSPLFAQNQTLSPAAEVGLITADPGTEIYSYFGHSALHIRDTMVGVDRVFNYGTFDFNTPNFYAKFIQGRLQYKLSAARFNLFLDNYVEDNRSLYEQKLNLQPNEVQSLYNLLIENYRPENREYLYDFFFDNCATRIRDIVEKAVPQRIHFKEDTLTKPLTFRELIDPLIRQNKWLDFGIDLILGAKTDRIATQREYMFLPDYLKKAFDMAEIDSNGTRIPLVKSTQTLFQATPVVHEHNFGSFLLFPSSIFSLFFLFTLLLSFIAYKRGWRLWFFDALLFGIMGALGWILLFCWFGTDHKVLVNNYNLLWALPLHIPLFFVIGKLSLHQQRYYWLLTAMLLLIAALIGVFQTPQGLHQVVLPICNILIFRCMANNVRLSKMISIKN